ncbi:MAG: DUF2804 domain-containing protein, partial [Acidimicrobiia bacterium]|nr:DUF2804 domain-containing protein [Acidimicrobiia bacterium]
ANLGGWGSNKRWDYWAVLAADLVISCVYSDIDHLGLADVYWVDLATGGSGGAAIVTEPGVLHLPERCGTETLHIERDGLDLTIAADDAHGTHLSATWTEADGRAGRFDVVVARPAGLESLNVVIPWTDDLFNFTSKHQARPATGELVVGDQRWEIGQGSDAWGVLDVGRGRWPHEISWNWGGGAGRSGDHVIGLQFGAKWTAGTGFTENGLIVDGVLTKLGNELTWDYDWDEPLAPWTVTDPDGHLRVVLTPRFDKHTDVGDEKFGSEVHQVFGTWAGQLTTDEGLRLEFADALGFAEEARQRW